MSDLNVQFGCGFRAAPSWINYDVSPTLRLSKIPGMKRLLKLPSWPANVRHGDITRSLPLAAGSCTRLYADQVLEHLARQSALAGLKECRRLLSADGIFRLFVPDLRAIASSYLESQDPAAADWFMETIGLGLPSRPGTMGQHLRHYLGNSRHLWAWDAGSMGKALTESGFTRVRKVNYRDSVELAFDELERDPNWELALGMEARC